MLPASGSVEDRVPTTVPEALFSVTTVFDNTRVVGASFVSVTEMVNTCSVDNPPWSVARTRTE